MRWQRRLALLMCVGLVAAWLLTFPVALAQPPDAQPPEIAPPKKQAVLLSLLQSMAQLEQELADKQEELRSPRAEGRQEELTQQIQKIAEKLAALRKNFTEFATGVDLGVFGEPEAVELDWGKQLRDLLGPVLNEVRQLTARPREIDWLRTEIARYQAQLTMVEKALGTLETLQQPGTDPLLATELQRLQREWTMRRQDLTTQIHIAEQQLAQKLRGRQTLSETLQQLFQIFFRSRGRNFLLACLAFGGCWLGITLGAWGLQRVLPARWQRHTLSGRIAKVAVMLFKIFGAIFAFQFVLYLLEDWVLLAVSVIFLLGMAWASKETLPRFWQQAMLLLNLGAVREGERIIYQGVPWRVHSLNVYTHLVNPALVGGDVRLPLRHLYELHSRPAGPDEPWFPTRRDDWVLLADQTFGKVILQTPEVVRLVLLGGSRRTFSTSDFLAQHPTVLSTGFRLGVSFGLDYRHQARITREIPVTLEARLLRELVQAGYEKDIVKLTVEFEEAGASSLNVHVLSDFTGAVAPQYWILRRAMQRICVEACNDYGWVIPFTQFTLHMAPAPEQVSE